jgi:CubicO group peptidase (beta-lactamase class C family)
MMKKLLALFAVAVLLCTPLHAQAPPPATAPAPLKPAGLDPAALQQQIDDLMQGHVKATGFSGTILLAAQGKPLVAGGYGYANIEWQIPNAPDTKFRIGSVTKQFTSMLIMQLREHGKLKVEDSVCMFITPCPDAWKPVTVHHLLTHTSGIPTYTGLKTWRDTMMMPRTVDQMIDLFRELPLEWVPGEKYAYNNSGYFLLGAIIEKVTEKKYDAALKDMILEPLGMRDTGYDWSGTVLSRRASGYVGRGEKIANAPYLDMQHPYSAGSMYSTVEDLLKWDQALYTEKLLPEAAKQIMWTPFKNNYAYGWTIVAPSAATFWHRRIVHTGGINGFSSVIVRLPDSNVTAVVLSNNSTVNAGAVGRDLLAVYFGQK